jgi:hypothetical protein
MKQSQGCAVRHRKPFPPFVRVALPEVLRAQLWQSLRSRVPHLLGHLLVVSMMLGFAALTSWMAWTEPRRWSGLTWLCGGLALVAILVAFVMARYMGRKVAPLVVALWRGEAWGMACPGAALGPVWNPREGCSIALEGVALASPLVMVLPARFRRLDDTFVTALVMYPRATPLQVYVERGTPDVLLGIQHLDESAPSIQRTPLQHWPLPVVAFTTGQIVGAVVSGSLAFTAIVALTVVLRGSDASALFFAVLGAVGAGWAVFRVWRPVAMACMHRGARPELHIVEGRAQGMIEIVQLWTQSRAHVHVRHERWLLLGNHWHLLDTALTPAPDTLPAFPPTLDRVRLEYAQWGRERQLARAIDDQGRWIGGALRPPQG